MFTTRMAWILSVALTLGFAPVAWADTIHAYEGESIQAAINGASGGDEIVVHPGTYVELLDLLGKAITLRSSDGPAVTILDGDAAGTVITCDSREGPDTVIEGFTVTNADGHFGGGMYNEGSSPTLTDCTFSGNSATACGGGMHNRDSSSPTLINCTFSGNSAVAGGGMQNDSDSSPTLTDCTFSGNSANVGGGMANDDSSPTLTNCTFGGNSARDGAGMYNQDGSSPTLTNCTFSGNTAGPNFSSGGGMYNQWGSSPTLTNCTFHGNSAGGEAGIGGGMWNYESSPTLTNCTFTGNSTNYAGGGMWSKYSSPTLTNCTFSGNAASPQLGRGGGMRNEYSSPTLANCIVWGNTARIIPQIDDGGGTTTATYSCVQGGWPGVGNINADPLFTAGVHVQAGSPCIDSGDNTAPGLVEITTDLDGWPRFVDDPLTPDTGFGDPPIVDMGVYEYGAAPPGACCYPDGSCAVEKSADCTAGGGIAQAPETTCEPNPCPQPEACCYLDGSCVDELAATCAANGGTPQGLASECATTNCPQPATIHVYEGESIQAAIDAASGYEEIIVHPGTYVERINMRGKPITLRSSDRSEATILDGDAGGTVITCDSGEGPDTVIDGFTITNGDMPSSGGGGMVNRDGSSPTVTNCAFSGNSAWLGGGMANIRSSPTVTNCTFSGNSANSANSRGGGMYNFDNNPTVTNCTFSGNTAGGAGGGIYNWDDGSPTLVSCIVWGNTQSSGSQIHDHTAGTTTVTYSCIQGGWPGVGNIDADPLFIEGLRLQAASPCIDAGNNAAVPPDVSDLDGDGDTAEPCPLDLDGRPRFVDDPVTPDTGFGDPPISDMGAYEYIAGACCYPDGSCAVAPSADCTAGGGIAQAPGSTCDPIPCPQPEACCYPDGSCADELVATCAANGGTPQGLGTKCGEDSDGDGAPDCMDPCPLDGDTDGDGVDDCLDQCPNDPLKLDPGACGCGVADSDDDNDGVPNCEDSCPNDSGKLDPGDCGCGASDADEDGNGIADCLDAPKPPPGFVFRFCGLGSSLALSAAILSLIPIKLSRRRHQRRRPARCERPRRRR